jgi:hypothetical protein
MTVLALERLFQDLTRDSFERLGLKDPDLSPYVSGLLVTFTAMDSLYRIRDAAGRPVEDVAEMLFESDVRHRATSFERERLVRKHIGDYTLFFSGMFPEHVATLRTRARIESFVDWIEMGRESYRVVAAFDAWPYAEEAPLFRKLADHFDFLVAGLNLVRDDLVRHGGPLFDGPAPIPPPAGNP